MTHAKTTHQTLVRTERHGDVVVIVIDHPPVNALALPVRRALLAAVEHVGQETGVRAVVLACDGRTFVAGADIREFDAPPEAPLIADVCAALDACPYPVVAALHGTALGGGFELALACDARILAPDGRVGQPESRLGLIPGAGGTQRLPRLIGALAALDLIASGRHVAADEAMALGLVDEIATDTRAAAIARARALAGKARPAPLRDRAVPPVDRAAFDRAALSVRTRARGALAQAAAAEAIGWALDLPFDEAMARERARSVELRLGPQSRGLRYLFHAERVASRLPAGPAAHPWPVRLVGVVGGGTMGSGIAVALADAGLQVTLAEVSSEAIEAAAGRVHGVYDRQTRTGRLSEQARRDRLDRIAFTPVLDTLAECDLVVEAVVEDMAVKQAVFRRLSAIVRRDCVLASNTSYLDIDQMADVVDAPERVLGLHFFSPAHVMRLVEVVGAQRTVAEATALAVARRLGKQPVLCGNGPGFIGNRLLMHWRQVCEFALEAGALPSEVDAAIEAYGYPLGYFGVADLAGIDIVLAVHTQMASLRDPAARESPVVAWLCELGRFGQKSGAGYYLHKGGKRVSDPAVTALIERASAARGIVRRPVPAETIQRETHAAMVNEAARVLAEGVAHRPSDIDVVLVHGYGYPAWRGGPMHEADAIGLPEMLRRVEDLHAAYGVGWEPAPLLREMVAAGKRFSDLNL